MGRAPANYFSGRPSPSGSSRMRSNGNDGERLAVRFTSEGGMTDIERGDEDESRTPSSQPALRARGAKPRAKKPSSKSIAPKAAAVDDGESEGSSARSA